MKNSKDNVLKKNPPIIHKIMFNNNEILIVDKGVEPNVSAKSISDGIGLNWWNQFKKLDIRRKEFECGYVDTVTPYLKIKKVFCISARKLNEWLSEINQNALKEETKNNLLFYIAECSNFIKTYWNDGSAEEFRMSQKKKNKKQIKLTGHAVALDIKKKYGFSGRPKLEDVNKMTTWERIKYVCNKNIEMVTYNPVDGVYGLHGEGFTSRFRESDIGTTMFYKIAREHTGLRPNRFDDNCHYMFLFAVKKVAKIL